MKLLSHASLVLLGFLVAQFAGCASQATFQSPQQAVDALFDATRKRDREAMRDLFGPNASDLLSGDVEQDKADFQRFAANLERHAEITPEKDGQISLLVGDNLVPFVAPLVKEDGKWRFDTEAGVEEITNRRIGRNELNVIKVGRAYARAQFEYYVLDPDNDGIRCYAQTVRSSPGKKDGLYWPDDDSDPNFIASPFGPLMEEAFAAKDLDPAKTKRQPYNGYYYRILTRQGGAASGGAKNYIDENARMTKGHALLAWPEEYDHTGVMSFYVDVDGVVYEKDLGENSTEEAAKINEFNPDGWKRVTP